jgi:hypothetical protein
MCSHRRTEVYDNVNTPTQIQEDKMYSYRKPTTIDLVTTYGIHIHRHDTFHMAVQKNIVLILGQEFIKMKCAIE